MIEVFSLETAHLLGDALPAAHRLRHRIFVERQKYDVRCWHGLEWDQFDTPAAVYLLWRDAGGRAGAVARLIPTHQPYMIQELWPEMVAEGGLPGSDDVWEITRFGVDRKLDAACRAQALGEMLCAFAEYGLAHGIRSYLFVTPPQVITVAFEHAGIAVERLGTERRLGRFPVVAARAPVTWQALRRLRRHHRVAGSVLRIAAELPRAA